MIVALRGNFVSRICTTRPQGAKLSLRYMLSLMTSQHDGSKECNPLHPISFFKSIIPIMENIPAGA